MIACPKLYNGAVPFSISLMTRQNILPPDGLVLDCCPESMKQLRRFSCGAFPAYCRKLRSADYTPIRNSTLPLYANTVISGCNTPPYLIGGSFYNFCLERTQCDICEKIAITQRAVQSDFQAPSSNPGKQWLQCVPSTEHTAVTHQIYSASNFQICNKDNRCSGTPSLTGYVPRHIPSRFENTSQFLHRYWI